ncbi:MAG TPA: PTS system mannose/fructose/sorbose family transporter subunit IID, partial [bacterium]|nr:PTS system mannose/fructose/sorbose family transporter subunit IID [bacterium]
MADEPIVSLNRKDIVFAFLRSFFLQAAWNFERYLSYGMAYVLLPVLKKVYANQEDRSQALSRHLEYFN